VQDCSNFKKTQGRAAAGGYPLPPTFLQQKEQDALGGRFPLDRHKLRALLLDVRKIRKIRSHMLCNQRAMLKRGEMFKQISGVQLGAQAKISQ